MILPMAQEALEKPRQGFKPCRGCVAMLAMVQEGLEKVAGSSPASATGRNAGYGAGRFKEVTPFEKVSPLSRNAGYGAGRFKEVTPFEKVSPLSRNAGYGAGRFRARLSRFLKPGKSVAMLPMVQEGLKR